MNIQVGDIWEDSTGRHVEILWQSSNTARAWWVSEVNSNAGNILLWESELIELISSGPMPFGWDNLGSYNTEVAGCQHEWADAGFHFSVWCCRKCNVDKPKE